MRSRVGSIHGPDLDVIALSDIDANEGPIVLRDIDVIRLPDIGSIVLPAIEADESDIVLLDMDAIRLSDIGAIVLRDSGESNVSDAGKNSVPGAGAATARSIVKSSSNRAIAMVVRTDT
jgi:hypothetical protein